MRRSPALLLLAGLTACSYADPTPAPEPTATATSQPSGSVADKTDPNDGWGDDGEQANIDTTTKLEDGLRWSAKPGDSPDMGFRLAEPNEQQAPPEIAEKIGTGSGSGLIGLERPTGGEDLAKAKDTKPQGGERYADYGINPLTMVDADRFSTFAADVDTASYTLARAKLNSGWLPNTASVRVEEFVNAIDYDYAPPSRTSEAPFAVSMEAAPSPWDRAHHVLRVGLQGEHVDIESAAPVHLTFLIDVSGSMNTPAKLDLAKASMGVMVDHLGPDDTVAIATYAGASEVLLEPTTDRDAMRRAIDGIRAGGGTHMDSGMNLAYGMAASTNVPGHESRVIVLSDGDANIGRTSVEEILARVEGYTEEGITLTTIGLGMGDYNDVLMEQLANQGDGAYFYVDSQAEADRVFGDDLLGTTRVIAKDVKIQVEFNPEAVLAYRLIGYENRDVADHQFRNDQIDAGEIGSGHQVTALYDVVLRDGASSTELATVRLRAKPPGPDAPAREWATTMSGSMLRGELADSSDDFRTAVATASFAELLRGSPYVAELSYRDVYSLALGAGSDRELLGLIETAGRLSGEQDVALAAR